MGGVMRLTIPSDEQPVAAWLIDDASERHAVTTFSSMENTHALTYRALERLGLVGSYGNEGVLYDHDQLPLFYFRSKSRLPDSFPCSLKRVGECEAIRNDTCRYLNHGTGVASSPKYQVCRLLI
ncbi:hypothetical protein SPH9361_04697 [Sphingobium sp. CECT 9361]|nr:hypothetical protein SPH9361_04697 [Sphingobium sp. CECT 9361]